jgi:hypothetical protein
MEFIGRHPGWAIYFAGCVAAFIWSMFFLASYMLAPFTVQGRNLRAIGCRISWTNGRPKEISEEDLGSDFKRFMQKLGLVLIYYALASLTSWLFLVTSPLSFASAFVKNLSAPREVREARWRIKNIALDFDGVLSNLKKIEGKSEYSVEREKLLQSLMERKLITLNQYESMSREAMGES